MFKFKSVLNSIELSSVDTGPEVSRIDTETNVRGKISFDKNLDFMGKLEGQIESEEGSLKIAYKAKIEGDIRSRIVHIQGEVNGDVLTKEYLVLEDDAVLIGNIKARNLSISPQSTIIGHCQMLADAESFDFFSIPLEDLRNQLQNSANKTGIRKLFWDTEDASASPVS